MYKNKCQKYRQKLKYLDATKNMTLLVSPKKWWVRSQDCNIVKVDYGLFRKDRQEEKVKRYTV